MEEFNEPTDAMSDKKGAATKDVKPVKLSTGRDESGIVAKFAGSRRLGCV